MKIYLPICLFFGFCSSIAFAINENEVRNFDFDRDLSPEELEELRGLVNKELNLHDLSKLQNTIIEVELNDYMDRLLSNVRELIIKNGIDPTSLPDQKIDIHVGKTKLTEGQLNDTSKIERYENATLSYNTDTQKLIAQMTIRFEDLKFIYKYHTKVTFISMTGHVHGNVKHVHINVQLGFDLKQGLLFVNSINFKHTGSITIKVSGNSLIDWITDAMSFVITGVLHDLILSTIKNIIANPINSIVETVNNFLHPTSFL
ncbi:unnamed protein product [Ceutorhynchus assimilis]|uniref:Uncharacterized protein n=1 Tax=Ceutorhynchus assimilis TaxID=467358 RepID=A0A9N9QGT6_9CUCU|nr:unnamed protein product [Ceutorhynchus assimilis]